MCLMAINAVYFGWKFMEVSSPQMTMEMKSSPQAGVRVQLLSESSLQLAAPAGAGAQPAPEQPEAEQPAEAAAPRQCFNIGPFSSEAAARAIVGQLRGDRFTVRVDKRKVDIKDYWVFIPAFTNRERADERMRELRARGISGFVVKDGPFINAISLNHFSQKELAQAFLAKMQEAGLTVESREMTSAGTQFWVYAAPGASRGELRGTIDAILGGRDALRREIASCEE